MFEISTDCERNRGVNQLALLSARGGEFESFSRGVDGNRHGCLRGDESSGKIRERGRIQVRA